MGEVGTMRRFILLSVIAVCGLMTAVSGQQSRAQLLAKLNSSDWSEALEQVRSDPVALSDPKIKTALIDLLERDNREPVHGEEEGYAEDRSWLADTAAKVVDWSNPHQVCVLANSVALPDELADHAKVAVPCLLRRLKYGINRYAPGPDISRGSVVAMLIQSFAKGQDELDSTTKNTIREITLKALRGTDVGMKIETVKALEKFGGEDMIPALKIVAETDPNPSQHYAIRRWASEAITAIQARTPQH